jgi:hypothetical protein
MGSIWFYKRPFVQVNPSDFDNAFDHDAAGRSYDSGWCGSALTPGCQRVPNVA